MKSVYLTLAAIVRDQEHYVKEWLAFHRIVGVERFVVMLHRCADRTEEKIRELPFADDIYIHHINESGFDSVQVGAYFEAVRMYGKFSKWLLFIDSDEFFFGTTEDSLAEILSRYECHGGLAAHWMNFGHNDHSNRRSVFKDGRLSIEAFTKRLGGDGGINRVVKCAVQTEQLVSILSPHRQITMLPIVREHRDELVANHYRTEIPATWDIVRCNHYHTRSMEDWVARSYRGSCNTIYDPDSIYGVRRFIERGGGTVEDGTILRFVDRIKEVIQ